MSANDDHAIKFLLLLLSAGIIADSTVLSGFVGTTLVIVLYLLYPPYLLYTDRVPFCFSGYSLFCVAGLFSVYLGHVLNGNVDHFTLSLLPFYGTYILSINLFVLPLAVERETLYYVLARLSAFVGLIGVPTLFLGQFELGPIELVASRKDVLFLPVAGALRSVFSNANSMGLLTFVGVLSGIAEFRRRRTNAALALIFTNAIFLYLTQSRTSIAAAAAGVTVYAVAAFGTRYLFASLLAGGISSAAFVLAAAGYPVRIPILSTLDISSRGFLWNAALTAAERSPLIGGGIIDTGRYIRPYLARGYLKGLSPHNSYLEILLETGLVGAVLYISLTWGNLLRYVKKTRVDSSIVAMLAGFLVTLTFEAYTVFGVQFHSLLLSLFLGYVIFDASTENSRNAIFYVTFVRGSTADPIHSVRRWRVERARQRRS